jgi:hypothetical protein
MAPAADQFSGQGRLERTAKLAVLALPFRETAMMRASIFKPLTRPAVGPAATVLALVLAGALTATSLHAAKAEARLKAEVAALAQRNEQADLRWQAKLSECRTDAAGPPGRPAAPPSGLTRVAQDDDSVADKLASQGPAGFDVCARMEAADAAVLASLRNK